MEARFIVLPDGQDPDEFFKAEGKAGIEHLRKLALKPMAFAVDFLRQEMGIAPNAAPTPVEKADMFKQLAQMIRGCDSQIVREGYLNELSRLLQIDRDCARREFQALERRGLRAETRVSAPVAPAQNQKNAPRELTTLEEALLLIVLNNAEIALGLARIVEGEWLDTSTLQGRLLDRILAALREGEISDSRRLDTLLETDSERDCLNRYLSYPLEAEDPLREANTALADLQKRFCLREATRIKNRLNALNGGEPQEAGLLFAQLRQLQKRLNAPQLLQE
jgi:DNA primase